MLRLDPVTGWCRGVRQVPSPNYDCRPDGVEIDLLVVHAISLPPGCFGSGHVEALFLNRLAAVEHPYFRALTGLRVSAHFFIRRHGSVTQYVATHGRAWHAGASCHEGRERCNDFSLGIELEGSEETPFTPRQYAALAELTNELMRCFPRLSAERIVGHSDIAPGRKTDPGPLFDWVEFRQLLASTEIPIRR